MILKWFYWTEQNLNKTKFGKDCGKKGDWYWRKNTDTEFFF